MTQRLLHKTIVTNFPKKINELTRIINDAAVYRKNASAVFMVNKTTSTETARTQLDIAI